MRAACPLLNRMAKTSEWAGIFCKAEASANRIPPMNVSPRTCLGRNDAVEMNGELGCLSARPRAEHRHERDHQTTNIFACVEWPARARSTAPEAGALPMTIAAIRKRIAPVLGRRNAARASGIRISRSLGSVPTPLLPRTAAPQTSPQIGLSEWSPWFGLSSPTQSENGNSRHKE